MVIVLVTLLAATAAAAATSLTSPRYEASTQLFFSVENTATAEELERPAEELERGGNFAASQVRSYTEAVISPRVLDAVVISIGLEETAEELAETITAVVPTGTLNILITVTRESASEAADIANAIASIFSTVVGDISDDKITADVLVQAFESENAVSPNAQLNLALGVLVGLAVGVGLAVLRAVLDTRIRGQRDIAEITTAPIIGGIFLDPEAVKRPLMLQSDPNSPRAEAFRTLRTNLQFLDVETRARSFVVTSSVPAEGKSTTAVNLAIAVSDADLRVLLIDADLRHSKLAEYLGVEGAIGLSDVLINQVSLHDAVQTWGRNGMAVLPAGAVPPNPSELLGSRAMSDLMRALEQDFDVIIIDTPPLLPVADAALLSKTVGGALVVAAAGRTHRAELAAALSVLDDVRANIYGVIVTMLPVKGPDASSYGRYGYAYAYGGYSVAATSGDSPTQRGRADA
jgi:capsular exopolysaccharide synthesis family protein